MLHNILFIYTKWCHYTLLSFINLVPVSYTHLDVYKRQAMLTWPWHSPIWGNPSKILNSCDNFIGCKQS